jgi:putative acetyltransferase
VLRHLLHVDVRLAWICARRRAMPSNMTRRLRAYRDDDLDALVETFNDAVHVLGRAFYDEAQCAAWAPEQVNLDEWRSRLAGITVLVAVKDGRLSGFIGYEPSGHVAYLYTASRAARTGVASELYAYVEQEWRAAGVERAFAEVSLAARPFFDRQGFAVEREERVERRGVLFTRFVMAKRLTSSRAP